ncbi:MAG TPA: methyltransferase domain-containing protein [Thermodesulfobacteriaceae bacterium]|nr:methyltransferase domain-containing protein [Thermodesulfobacteriaceae bacterium]
MLRPPYKRYETLYLYAFSGCHPDLRVLPDPDFIGCWEEDGLSVLFFHREKDGLPEKISQFYGLKFELSAAVPYEEWGEGRRLTPFRVGPLSLAPVWEEGSYDLRFDPGVVFGSGGHPTTRLMLELLWELWEKAGPFTQVLDLGCGSGLLTLLAAKLGAMVTAVDRNPLCVALTKKNLEINGLSAEVLEEDVRKVIGRPVDLVLANLYKGLLLELLGLPSFQTSRYYLISGFVISMESELREAILGAGFEIEDRKEEEGWVCILLRNPKT